MTLTKYAANAIIAKVRAIYGKRLKEKDYQSLLGCLSVGEVMSYLKSHTKYSTVLNSISERDVHRGQLETLLKQKLMQEFASLSRYEMATGESFSEYLINKAEAEQILHFLMLLNSGNTERYLFDLPSNLNAHTKIDLKAMSKAKNFDEFLVSLDKSHYRKLLEPFRPKENETLNIPKIENAIYSDMFKNLFNIINHHTKGKEKKELTELFSIHIDFMNFVLILRLQKYYHMSPEQIRGLLLSAGSIKESMLMEMCAAQSSEELFDVAARSRVGRRIEKLDYNYESEVGKRGFFLYTRRQIRFSTVPTVVLMSYLFLEQIELRNIICIIEGVRYDVDPEMIRKLLIYQ